jgi:serine/threonine protein kinase/Flp pilus assembly protein TadD
MGIPVNQARAIFLEAIEQPDAAARESFIASACGGDADLQLRVERLIESHEKLGSFHDQSPSPAATIDQLQLEKPGTSIGPYKLLEQIGEGGMGAVWMAQQHEPIKRLVAVKLIKPGMDSRQIIARFEAERQALALMDHANIARVLDAGTSSAGRPYFVMELVRGVPITRYCDEHHLTPRQRLELFIPVCQAIQHAHQKGIIHRDLKPSNVLVAQYDGRPVPKVIDFGVAKAAGQSLTEMTLVTGFGAIVGSLEYMSPEQAEVNQLDIDTRSDIYSLGVLLYELLTGSPPFSRSELAQAGMLEMLRVIREQEPTRPSTKLSTDEGLPALAASRGTEPAKLTKLLRGELDWIVLKALEKDRSRRYETANSLAQDLARYLDDEPVLACPPSSAYRLRKFLRRHKVAALAAFVVAASLFLGTGVSIWQAAVARQAQFAAAERLVRETQAHQQAAAINALLQEGLASANPDSARGTGYTVRQLLDDISSRLDEQLRDQPAAEAAIRSTIGNAYFRLGLPDKAAPHLKRSLELREMLYGAGSPEVARGLFDEAWNRQEYGDVPGALERANRALAIHRQAGLRNTDTVRILWLFQLLHRRAGREDLSEQVGQEALVLARELPEARPELASVLHTLAASFMRLGRDQGEAERMTREAIELHRKYNGDNHPQTARALSQLGSLLANQGKHEQAEAYLRESLDIFARHFDYISEGDIPSYTFLVSTLRGRKDETGLDALRTDVTNRANRVRQERPDDAGPLFYAALAQAIVGEMDGAAETLAQIKAAHPGKFKVWYFRINHLAWLFAIRPDSHERYPGVALDLAQQVLELAPEDREAWQTLGMAHYRAANWRAAIEALNRSTELPVRQGRADPTWLFLAMAHWQVGEKDRARECYHKAVEWIETNQPKNQFLQQFRKEAEEVMNREPGAGSRQSGSGNRENGRN